MKPKKIHYLLTILLPFQVLFIGWLSLHPELVEEYYSKGFYPIISSLFRILFGWIPFSVGDLLLFYLIFIVLRFLYKTIKTFKKTWLLRLFQFTSFFSVLYFCFYLFWALNYFREPLAKNLGFENKKYTTEQLINLTNFLIQKTNKSHLKISSDSSLIPVFPYEKKEIYAIAKESYVQLEKSYPQFKYKHTSVKSSLMSLLQSYNGTSGYMNPLSEEAQVNDKIPMTGYPTTTCHEIAHQIGFAAENEANFIGFLAASHSKDMHFQYSAYRMALRYTIFELYKRDQQVYKAMIAKVNRGILNDYNRSNEFWKQYANPLEPLIKKGYNNYLKANNQQKGIQSYNYVVDLLISYYEL